MPLQSPARTTLIAQVIEQLRAQVTSGEWPVGSRIPPEPQLAAALGVGRNTLREAVLALVHSGILARRQGSGTFVVGADELLSAVTRRVADAHLAEVLEVRRALEVEAARLAALRRTPEDLASLDGALVAREAAWDGGDAAAFVAADAQLHLAVITAAHNRVLADLYRDLGTAMLASLAANIGTDLSPERHMDHARLVDAVRAGDPDAAAAEAAAFFDPPMPG